jgi:hypothetical protein
MANLFLSPLVSSAQPPHACFPSQVLCSPAAHAHHPSQVLGALDLMLLPWSRKPLPTGLGHPAPAFISARYSRLMVTQEEPLLMVLLKA